jgi:hypothetical protein
MFFYCEERMMRYVHALALAFLLSAYGYAEAQHLSGSPQVTIAPQETTAMVYPVIKEISPSTITVPIPAAAGTVVATQWRIARHSDDAERPAADLLPLRSCHA